VHEELERTGRLAALPERWPNVRLEVLPELRDVHTFQTRALQREAHARVDAAIAADLAALRGGAAAAAATTGAGTGAGAPAS
jgi:hypothetical protein